jgi:hypothetical protein
VRSRLARFGETPIYCDAVELTGIEPDAFVRCCGRTLNA